MVKTKEDYKYYLKSDYVAAGIDGCGFLKRLTDRRFKFYKSLRLSEYYTNRKKNIFVSTVGKMLRVRHRCLCDKYGWTIPINVFGRGLAIVHTGTIVVSGHAKVGEFCRIHVCTNIGYATAKGQDGTPVIGDRVYIGPGAKIFGPITIGDNTVIGANAVVNESFADGNCTIAGVPAKKISDNTSADLILNIHL